MSKDKHLIYEYQKDDGLDLDKIMSDFGPYVRTIINNMVMNNLNYEDKEEILSDAFFILWKNQDKITSTIEAYIAGITRTLIKEKLRKRKITSDITEYENVINSFDVFQDDILECEVIGKYVKRLKKMDVQIITMFYYYSKTTKEIAKELNLSEVNIRTRLFRIRNKIRKEINS